MRRRRGEPERVRVLGRLPYLIALFVSLAAAGCDESGEKEAGVAKSRAAAVETMQPSPAASAPAPAAAPAPSTAARKTPLCAGQMGRPPKPAPKGALSRKGSPALPEKLPVGDGAWTWVNFWAAWCVPCKEEIPRLKDWEKQLSSGPQKLRVAFVSLDDDERQLTSFLESQPEGGLRSTYWLEDGKQREEWLKEIGIEGEPELPAHALIDPSGKVRCVEQGAVEDRDFERVQRILERGARPKTGETGGKKPKGG